MSAKAARVWQTADPHSKTVQITYPCYFIRVLQWCRDLKACHSNGEVRMGKIAGCQHQHCCVLCENLHSSKDEQLRIVQSYKKKRLFLQVHCFVASLSTVMVMETVFPKK